MAQDGDWSSLVPCKVIILKFGNQTKANAGLHACLTFIKIDFVMCVAYQFEQKVSRLMQFLLMTIMVMLNMMFMQMHSSLPFMKPWMRPHLQSTFSKRW